MDYVLLFVLVTLLITARLLLLCNAKLKRSLAREAELHRKIDEYFRSEP